MWNIKRLFKFFHLKWVKGECRHFCAFCEHFDKCYLDLEV